MLKTQKESYLRNRQSNRRKPKNTSQAHQSEVFSNPPPVLIQVGENEAYFSDSARLADRLAQANVDVRLQKWPRVFHVWQAWSPLLPQAREAVASAAEFIKRQLA
ncbi:MULTISPECIES: alpha/beta hydrolase [Komagataeibacter]|uniref:alpha/beta hydrolase n=1 Tax=Komagataeibacter TaxID=1434011 RepID=UPI001607C7EF|nr:MULTISPECIES: alpha/beta hydrolase [Komagataeibacter]MBE7729829.1 alpha/beta hydrolase fold domain-containing protein [Komagataeibacter sp. FXV3]